MSYMLFSVSLALIVLSGALGILDFMLRKQENVPNPIIRYLIVGPNIIVLAIIGIVHVTTGEPVEIYSLEEIVSNRLYLIDMLEGINIAFCVVHLLRYPGEEVEYEEESKPIEPFMDQSQDYQ